MTKITNHKEEQPNEVEYCPVCGIMELSGSWAEDIGTCQYCYLVGDYHIDNPDEDTEEARARREGHEGGNMIVHTRIIDIICKMLGCSRIPSHHGREYDRTLN